MHNELIILLLKLMNFCFFALGKQILREDCPEGKMAFNFFFFQSCLTLGISNDFPWERYKYTYMYFLESNIFLDRPLNY